MRLGTRRRKKSLPTSKRRPFLSLPLANKTVTEQPMCHNCVSLYSVWSGKVKESLQNSFCSRVTRIETKMMLIVFLGLIAKLTSVSGNCGDGIQGVKNLNWNKVGVRVLTQFLK
jgi:hypothetical protein